MRLFGHKINKPGWLNHGHGLSDNNVTVTIAGLTSGEARPGQHASITMSVNTGLIAARRWGSTSGGSQYGTGTNPTDYTAGDGGTLYAGAQVNGSWFQKTAPIRYALPVNTVLPVVTGSTGLGDVLSTTNGTWSGGGLTFTYQWQRDGIDIGGATASSYMIMLADANTDLRCVVTATNSGGSVSVNSNTISLGSFGPPAIIDSVVVGAYSPTPVPNLPLTVDASGAVNGVDIVYGVLVSQGSTPPTASQIRTATAPGQLDDFSFTWNTGGVAAFPISGGIDENCDLYVVIDNGSLSNVGSYLDFAVNSISVVIDSVVVGAYSATPVPNLSLTIDATGGEDGVDVIYGVLVAQGSGTPSAAQVKAATAAGLLDDFSFVWNTGGVAAFPIAGGINELCDLYVILDNGSLSNVGSYLNFLVDSTPSVLSSPTGTQTGATTADGSVTSNEGGGTIYAGVWPTASTPPAADIIAGTGAVYHTTETSPIVGVNPFAATGLTASTAFKWHFVKTDAFGNLSSAATSAEFTTASGAPVGTESQAIAAMVRIAFLEEPPAMIRTAAMTRVAFLEEPAQSVRVAALSRITILRNGGSVSPDEIALTLADYTNITNGNSVSDESSTSSWVAATSWYGRSFVRAYTIGGKFERQFTTPLAEGSIACGLQLSSGTGTQPAIIFRGATGDLFRIVTVGSNENWKGQYWNGSAWTDMGADVTTANLNSFRRLDVKWKIADSGGYFEIRINGTLYHSISGDTLFTSDTQITNVSFVGHPSAGEIRVSGLMVSSGDLASVWLEETVPTGNGGQTAWINNGFGNIDEVIGGRDPADWIRSSTVGDVSTFTFAAYPSPLSGYTPERVIIAQASLGATGSGLPIKGIVRKSSVNYESSNQVVPSGDVYTPAYYTFLNDPSTGSPWANAAAASGAELGVKTVTP